MLSPKFKEIEPGIILVDKPKGPTSHDIVDWARREFNTKKVGHAGTLDPLATGVLIILVGRDATKRQSEFMAKEKEYVAEVSFGVETDTYDAEGVVVKKVEKTLQKSEVEAALEEFKGVITQQVPAYSAVKIDGKKLYELARKGKSDQVELPSRRVEIKELEMVSFEERGTKFGNLPTATLRVVCSKGTYIRSLAHDLGQRLGCGAFLLNLRRTRIGKFSSE